MAEMRKPALAGNHHGDAGARTRYRRHLVRDGVRPNAKFVGRPDVVRFRAGLQEAARLLRPKETTQPGLHAVIVVGNEGMAAIVEDPVVSEPEERPGKMPVRPGDRRGKSSQAGVDRLAGAHGRELSQSFLQLGKIVQQAGVHRVSPILDRFGILRAVGSPLGVRVEGRLMMVLRSHGGQQRRERSRVADLRIVGDDKVLHTRPGEGSLHVVGMYEARPRGNCHNLAPVEDPELAPQLTYVAEPNVVGRVRKDVIDQVEPRYRWMPGRRHGHRWAPFRRVASCARFRESTLN